MFALRLDWKTNNYGTCAESLPKMRFSAVEET